MVEFGSIFFGFLAESSSGVLGSFGVHWQLILIQSLNFLCVVVVLYYFAFKPVLRTMEERRSKIETGLLYAEEMKVQLAQADVTANERLLHAKEEARRIIDEAKIYSKNYNDKQRAEMELLTQNMLEEAKQNIAREREKMVRDLKDDVKYLVADVAAKVLSKKMNIEEREQYLSAAEIEL